MQSGRLRKAGVIKGRLVSPLYPLLVWDGSDSSRPSGKFLAPGMPGCVQSLASFLRQKENLKSRGSEIGARIWAIMYIFQCKFESVGQEMFDGHKRAINAEDLS